MAPKACTTQGQRKYCAVHKSLGNHTTSECKGLKKTDDADKRCYLCNKTGHTMTTCPRRKEAADTDDDGKYVATKLCWNGCGENHLVSECHKPLCIKVIRMNEKEYFECKTEGRDFIPVRREQVMGSGAKPAPGPTIAAREEPAVIPVEFLRIEVKASCCWDGEKIADLLGDLDTAPDVNVVNDKGTELLALSFSSEHELVAAQQKLAEIQDGNGEHFVVRRRHAPMHRPSTPSTTIATSANTPGTQSGNAPWAADIAAIRTDHKKLESKVNVMGSRINKLSTETDRTQAFMLEFAEFSGMKNARAVMAKCGGDKEQQDVEPTIPKEDTATTSDKMEMNKESATGKPSTGEKSAEITIDATAQLKKVPTRTGPRYAPSACNPC